MYSHSTLKIVLFLLFAWLLLTSCSHNKEKINQIHLMPTPGVYGEGNVDPFEDNNPIERGLQPGVLFATDRERADSDDKKYDHFTHRRGDALTLGIANIQLGKDETMSWEEARKITLLKNRTEKYPLKVTGVENFGILENTLRPSATIKATGDITGERFSREVNQRLENNNTKEIYIYVHGFNINFENPLLVTSELWHYLGYSGVFISYSWPTKRNLFSYWADIETARFSSRNLRKFILYLANNTEAERIHLVGYSAGTRVVTRALADLGMFGAFLAKDEIKKHTKLGNVILIGSDVDPDTMTGYLLDGIMRVPDSLTIYQSAHDGALGFLSKILTQNRTGQADYDISSLTPVQKKFVEENPHFRIIDVTDAPGSDDGRGHNYFRSSPWVSSDVLMTLMYDLSPDKRGLVRENDIPIWRFPANYLEHLRMSLYQQGVLPCPHESCKVAE